MLAVSTAFADFFTVYKVFSYAVNALKNYVYIFALIRRGKMVLIPPFPVLEFLGFLNIFS